METQRVTRAVSRLTTFIYFVLAVFAVSIYPLAMHGADAPENAVVFFDATQRLALDFNDDRQRRAHWDEMHLIAALQGLVNRDHARLFIRYMRDPDDFWWEQMTKPGGWMASREVAHVNTLDELLARFRDAYNGYVISDETVPATSNLAATIAGCDNLLPLRYDPNEGSLYRHLTEAPGAPPVKVRLVGEDGAPMFTGTGKIPGTKQGSTGSAKNDAYRWLIENYVNTGKSNPLYMGYYMDSFWLRSAKASRPENSSLCNQDFVIAKRGVMFDLNVWDDEAPVDDPQQPPGTDLATLKKLLRASYDRFGGKGIIHVSGFVPWAYKYTDNVNAAWAAGGHHKGVPTEWQYVQILSCFNAYTDADALAFNAMANASFYMHYPLAAHYPQNPKPTRESLTERGILDAKGRIVPRTYISFYSGSYDSAAWLYHKLPEMWRDPARGTLPLTWPFDPNLSERFPLGMAWAREHKTKNDFFVAGDSGAGYLNPSLLLPPRPLSGLPSGLPAWEQYCTRLYRQWDLSLTGFLLEGFGPPLPPAGMDAYARFSPDGVIGQKMAAKGVHNGMPFLQMNADLKGTPEESAAIILEHINKGPNRFYCFRDVLKTPTWHAQLDQVLRRTLGEQIKIVDLYSLMWLVRYSQPEGKALTSSEMGQSPDDAEIAAGNVRLLPPRE